MNFKLGYFDWKVKFVDYELTDNEGNTALGVTIPDDKTIKVAKNHNLVKSEKETLFHELMHAAFGDEELVSDEVEERIILLLSPRLMEILDQPQIRGYLFGGRKDD